MFLPTHSEKPGVSFAQPGTPDVGGLPQHSGGFRVPFPPAQLRAKPKEETESSGVDFSRLHFSFIVSYLTNFSQSNMMFAAAWTSHVSPRAGQSLIFYTNYYVFVIYYFLPMSITITKKVIFTLTQSSQTTLCQRHCRNGVREGEGRRRRQRPRFSILSPFTPML